MGRPPTIHLFGFIAPSPSVYTLPEPLRLALPLVLHLSFGALSHTDLFLICLPFPSGEPFPCPRTAASLRPFLSPGPGPG